MPISLDDLQLLLDAAELGSFSQAAARRGWSQPQVSARMAQLEAELGVSLFHRHRRGAEATAACLSFLPAARAALNAYADGRQTLVLGDGLPQVRLVTLPSLAAVVFGPLASRLAEAPLELRCDTDHSPQILQKLLAGEADIGFMLERPTMAGMEQEVLCQSPVVAVAAATHPLAGEGELSLSQLAAYPLAPQRWGDAVDDLLRRLRPLRRTARPIHVLQPATAVRDLALWHGYVGFVPRLSVWQELEQGLLTELSLAEPELGQWRVTMAWRGGKRPLQARDAVLQAAREMARVWG